MGACEARGITIRESPFIEIGFDGAIRVSKKICRDAQNIDNHESNQCVLFHLVAGPQWVRTKKQQGIPDLPKVMLAVDEWRSDEIAQANMVMEWCSDRDDHVSHELRSLGHGVISACRDRD